MHPEPAHKGIEPTGARSFLRVHPEAMATLFIKMEFDGALRGLPAIDEPVAAVPEKRVVGSQGNEQWRRIGRHRDRRERTVDVADEGGLRILAGKRSCHSQHRAGGKPNHADPVGIDMPLGRPLPDKGKGGAGVGDLRGKTSDRLFGVGARRPRCTRKHFPHGFFEPWHVGRCLVQAILEDKRGDTLFRQRAGDVRAFIFHGQAEETAAGRDDNGGAACLGGIRKKGCQRRNRHVAGELTAVLAMPDLRVRRTGQRTGAEFDRVGLRRRGDGCHPVVLRMRWQCKPSDQRKPSDCQTKMG